MRTPPDQPLSRPLPAPGTPRAPAAAGTETELYDDPGWNTYIGYVWERSFGDTADFARADDEPVNEHRLVAGVRLWW
ncbi:copper resistance protein B [Immundisolibacter cernigliae]|uniref:copper resistance protein B n=1 Tax=Immundisolibacter cernigliae TaxID=1810504 RepID=UPI00096AD6CD